MKNIAALILLILSTVVSVSAQNVSYILPDIGSPGMNTYIEIIAHVDSIGTYGIDKTYWGAPSDELKIVFENPNDTNDVVVGPLIVSWNGRLISTQIFVNPDVNPNTWDWQALNSQFNKRFAVEYQGRRSVYQDFYVLHPTPLGDVTANPERYLGEGTLGKRSPRGAMIVDSLVLADKTYYPSLKDCDPVTPGNQAYLPFVLMAKYSIKGAANTVIDMTGGKRGQNTEIQDAAPGGGGGGGAFEDVNTDRSSGRRAGNGFTCGGFGGSNTFLISKTGYWVDINNSMSSFTGGFSLNGLKGGETKTFCAECAGGGTGHPFGKSGEGSDGQNDQSKVGYYGGGSGYSNDQNGGSAGYARPGTGPGSTGGKVHGNVMIVPLAGGSGGSSGNPQPEFVENEWGGSGGGGGGALRLYAREIIGLDIPAVGGEGEAADDAEGGNGSGGAIELSANSRLVDIKTNVSGNNKHGYVGGAGYIKINAANQSSIVDNTTNGLPIYNSVSSDSLQYVPRIFTLTGTKDASKDVKLMFKIGKNPWKDVSSFANIVGNSWSLDFDLTAYMTDKYFYFYAFQEETGVGANQYLNIPDGVLSQSAANIFIPVDEPMIGGDENVYMTVQACPDNEVTRECYLTNIGAVPLDIDFSSAMFARNTNGLSLVSPTSDIQLSKHKDSVAVNIKYVFQKGATGPIYDTLLVAHNDTRSGTPKPWRVAVTIFIEQFDYSILDENDSELNFSAGDELDLGRICRDELVQKPLYIKNNAIARFTTENFAWVNGNKGFTYQLIEDGPLDQDERASLIITYDDSAQPKTGIEVKDTLYFNLEECPEITDSVIVSVSFLYSTLFVGDDFNFGSVRVDETKTVTAKIENIGNSDALIQSLPAVAAPFSIISYSPSPLPVTLQPGESMTVTMEYAPTAENDDSGTFTVQSVKQGLSCAGSIDVPITASSYQSAIELSKDTLNFGIVPECDVPLDTLVLSNNPSASGNVLISRNPEITGADATYFELISFPPSPLSLAPGESREYVVELKSSATVAKIYEAELRIFTNEPNQDSLIIIPLIAEKDAFLISFDNITNPYATIETAVNYNTTVDITNNSKLPRNANLVSSDNSEAVITPNTYTFAPGETKQFDISINYSDTTELSLNIKVMFDSPCLDSLEQMLNFDVNYGLADVDLLKDFDTIAPCNEVSDTVFIRNIGTAPIEWRAVSLSNTYFNIIEQPTFASVIAPGDSNYIIIGFDAIGKDDGLYSVSADFFVYEYGKELVHSCIASVYIKSAVVATPSDITFGSVIEAYPSDTKRLTLTNVGTYDIEIVEVKFPLSTDFTLEVTELFAGGPAVNYPLSIGQSLEYDLNFTPNLIKTYSEVIEVIIRYSDCLDTLIIPFTAEGVPDNILTLSMPSITVDPALPEISIPLQASTSKFTIDSKLNNLSISFDRNVMKFLGMENASYHIIQTLDTLTVVFNDSTSYAIDTIPGTITKLHAIPLLGHIESTDLIINYIPEAGEKISEVVEDNGKVSLDICKEGGDRLLVQSNRTELIIEPNPANDKIQIRAFLLELGKYQIELFDLNGKRIYDNIIENTIFAGTEKTLEISTEKIGSGEYMMMLITPSQTISKKVVVIK